MVSNKVAENFLDKKVVSECHIPTMQCPYAKKVSQVEISPAYTSARLKLFSGANTGGCCKRAALAPRTEQGL